MKYAKTIGRELLGLFVDDGAFAAAILAWVAAVAVLLPLLGLPPDWQAGLLPAGLAVCVVVSCLRKRVLF